MWDFPNWQKPIDEDFYLSEMPTGQQYATDVTYYMVS